MGSREKSQTYRQNAKDDEVNEEFRFVLQMERFTRFFLPHKATNKKKKEVTLMSCSILRSLKMSFQRIFRTLR